jgi:parallel beta-helix repeat protein
MTRRNSLTRIVLSLSALTILITGGILYAGPLNPPAGPVTSTNKTLTEVEPRTSINATNTPGDNDATPSVYKITQSGSYYLTGNLNGAAGKHGIEIAAQNVTIDLRGFALIGAASSLSGIYSSTTFAVTVTGGSVVGWGDCGIDVQFIAGRIENIIAYNNGNWGIRNGLNGHASKIIGCEAYFNGSLVPGTGGGIATDNDALVVDCYASNNRGDGIFVAGGSRLVNCVCSSNQGDGIQTSVKCVLSGCTANDNIAKGMLIDGQSTITDCNASQNGSDGIFTFDGSNITACTATRNTGNGIVARAGSEIARCAANMNVGDGIVLNGDAGTVRACTAYFNGQGAVTTGNGINSTGLGASVLDCTAALNLLDGIRVAGRSRVVGNNCEANGFAAADGAGIHSTSSDNHIENNTVTGNDRGIDVDANGTLVVRNTAKVNTVNFAIAVNNKVGFIVAAPNSAVINGSTGGAGVGSTDPWANISY